MEVYRGVEVQLQLILDLRCRRRPGMTYQDARNYCHSVERPDVSLQTVTSLFRVEVCYRYYPQNQCFIYLQTYIFHYICGTGQLSRYCESLQDGLFDDRIPAGTRFSFPFQTGPGTHPASYRMGFGSVPGIKRPGRGVDHSQHLAWRLNKEQSQTSGPYGLCQGDLYIYFNFTLFCYCQNTSRWTYSHS